MLALGLLALSPHSATAGPTERMQAKRIYDRLVGVPPTDAVLNAMEASIVGGDPVAAAYTAMGDPIFYTSVLKNFATPWTNVDQTVFADLNDYTATIVGMIRDDVPFNTVLSADLVYVAPNGVVSAGYSQTDNNHYLQLQQNGVDLSNPANLQGVPQSTLPGSQINSTQAAGIITTRAAAQAYFSAGTNRRMWRFTGINFLCRDMEQLNDITRPADWIRQDVSRSPGGDSRIFHNTCVGCHSGMDGLAGAFAYYNWDATAMRMVYTANQVQPKFLINSTNFPGGHITTSDAWVNFWRVGPNSSLGWRSPGMGGGNGAQSLGVEIGSSRAFSECQVTKVFTRVCQHAPQSAAELAEVSTIADHFEAMNYSMKRVFAETAAYCMGN
ncbi:MAG: hypothetical protein ACHQ6T_06310 [Myxococcota bacterium]